VLGIQLFGFKQGDLEIFWTCWSIVVYSHLRAIMCTDWLLFPNLIWVSLNINKVLVELNRLEFGVVFQSLCVLIRQNHTLVLLILLLRNVCFDINHVLKHF
jgi:hypothetical protein